MRANLLQSIEQVVGNPAAQPGLRQVTIGLVRVAFFPFTVTCVTYDLEGIVQVNVIDAAKLLVGREQFQRPHRCVKNIVKISLVRYHVAETGIIVPEIDVGGVHALTQAVTFVMLRE